MSDENYGFCPHCGENLKSDSVYCPACGAIIKQEEAKAAIATAKPSSMGGALLFAFVLLVLYAIVELLGSISMLSFNSEMYAVIDQAFIESYGLSFADWVYDNLGIAFTEEQFLSQTFVIGITGLLSAIVAGVSAFLCYKRQNRMYATVACVCSAVIAAIGAIMCPVMGGGVFGALLTIVIGGLVAVLIYISKDYFEA
ncbi:MAG: zinc ribbon domain-containing protein [Candidatus Methanomethylophilaceae archaeon]